MTRKISISLPDDVAEQLDGYDNVSAVVTAAVRKHLMGITVRAALTNEGFPITDAGLEDAGREYDAAVAGITDETRIQAAKTYNEIMRARGHA